MQVETESGIWLEANEQLIRLIMSVDRTGRRMQAVNRIIVAAFNRVAQLRRRQDAQAAREHAAAERSVEQDFKRVWGPQIRVRTQKEYRKFGNSGKKRQASESKTAPASQRSRRLRSYKAQLRDAKRRVALFLLMRYVGFKSPGWRKGITAEHAMYILREAALELVQSGGLEPLPISNMGATPEEIADCWNAIEQIEAAYRANAKVQYRFILNLPHDLTAKQRRELVKNFCERELGRLGLPYVAAIHEPDPNGDNRNYHAHILFSTRPFERRGAGEWEFASEKVTELTDKAGMLRLRALAAAHLNTACRKAGLDLRFTHLSYRDRGINAQRQEHLGPARMAAHRMGQPVHMVARNASVVAANEAAVESVNLEQALAAHGRLSELLNRSLDLLQKRKSVASQLERAKALVATSKRIAEMPRRSMPTGLAKASMIAAQAGQIAKSLEVQSWRKRNMRPDALEGIANAAKEIAARFELQQQRRDNAVAARAKIDAVKLTIAAANDEARDREAKAASMIIHSERFKYRNTSRGFVMLDHGMERQDVALVNELRPDIFARAMNARAALDCAQDERKRKLDAEAARKAEIARTAMLVEEAVRLIRDAAVRPYRVKGNKLQYDLATLPNAHRKAITAVSHHRAVQEALIRRCNTDLAIDAAATASRVKAVEATIAPMAAEESKSPSNEQSVIETVKPSKQGEPELSDPKPGRQGVGSDALRAQMEDQFDRWYRSAKAADVRTQLTDDQIARRRRDELEAAKKGQSAQQDKPRQWPWPFNPSSLDPG